MKKFLFLPLLFFIAGCGSEYGVSQKGVSICLRRSNEASNKYTAEKIYKRCLKNIDRDIRKKRELAIEEGNKYWDDYHNYEKNLNKEDKAKYKKEIKERKAKVKLYEKKVLKTKDQFIDAGWTSIFEDKWGWVLGRDRRIAYKDYVVMRYYYLPKYERPKFNILSYSNQRPDETIKSADPRAWVLFDCVTGETQTISNNFSVFNTKDIDQRYAASIINKLRMNPPRKKGPIPPLSEYACQLINSPNQLN